MRISDWSSDVCSSDLDWFDREDLQAQFKELYGYDLGVPVNWSAYEDIAEFFTEHVKEIDGVRVYGHMDYGKRAPDLGWRMTDAWLSMAGSTSPGLPNGRPIDEWGIRMEEGSRSEEHTAELQSLMRSSYAVF